MVLQDPADVKQVCITTLKEVPIFSTLSDDDIWAISERANTKTYKAQKTVMLQDETGYFFFVILDGDVVLTKIDDSGSNVFKSTVGTLSRGDFFGEEGVAPKSDVRPYTATSTSALEVMQISKKLFNELGLRAKVTFTRASKTKNADPMSGTTEETAPPADA